MNRLGATLLAIVLLVGTGTTATAASGPKTRLVECGAQNCLVITGRRQNPESEISVNGRTVAVTGHHRWRIRLPVETIKQWSMPYARTISVGVGGKEKDAKLPVGLMGHADLSMLVITAK